MLVGPGEPYNTSCASVHGACCRAPSTGSPPGGQHQPDPYRTPSPPSNPICPHDTHSSSARGRGCSGAPRGGCGPPRSQSWPPQTWPSGPWRPAKGQRKTALSCRSLRAPCSLASWSMAASKGAPTGSLYASLLVHPTHGRAAQHGACMACRTAIAASPAAHTCSAA